VEGELVRGYCWGSLGVAGGWKGNVVVAGEGKPVGQLREESSGEGRGGCVWVEGEWKDEDGEQKGRGAPLL
jgi:hypothetical protein